MRFDVVTLFPELFNSPFSVGLTGKAISQGIATVDFVDPRTFTNDRHRTVDDTPYGGGAGMVMKPEPLVQAIELARARGGGPVLLMSPQGRPLHQDDLFEWSKLPHLVLVSARYEGYDARINSHVDQEISLGDFVLTGGEYAALAIIDGVVRLLPGTLGNETSPLEESFSTGLLEHPHFTRPAVFDGTPVPEVLLSGHHAEIAAWRHARSLERTRARRPDLLAQRGFDEKERAVLRTAASRIPFVEALVLIAPEQAGKLSRIASTYGAALTIVSSRDELDRELASRRDSSLIVSASPYAFKHLPTIGPRLLVDRARRESKVIVLVLAADLSRKGALNVDALLPSVRSVQVDNDLPLPTILGILLDRLIGEG